MFLAEWRHCFGLRQPELYAGTRCCAKCDTHGPGTDIDEVQWASGAHAFSCGKSPWRLRRHNKLGRGPLKDLYKEMGYDWNEDEVSCHVNNGERVDAICRNFSASAEPDAVDITVGCASCPTYLCEAAARQPDYLTKELEKGKTNKHGAAAAALGMQLVPAAFTTYGGWGDVMLKKLKKEYAEKRLAEKKAGGTGWKAQRWKQDILERASISIAKSNYEMLRCHCTAPYA